MVCKLPRRMQPYTIYLDNYFTSISLFKRLKDRTIAACGTTRPIAAGSDFPVICKQLKDYTGKVPWGTIATEVVRDVLCVAWCDNNVVSALTTAHTVHNVTNTVTRLRKRPSSTSTNAKVV